MNLGASRKSTSNPKCRWRSKSGAQLLRTVTLLSLAKQTKSRTSFETAGLIEFFDNLFNFAYGPNTALAIGMNCVNFSHLCNEIDQWGVSISYWSKPVLAAVLPAANSPLSTRMAPTPSRVRK